MLGVVTLVTISGIISLLFMIRMVNISAEQIMLQSLLFGSDRASWIVVSVKRCNIFLVLLHWLFMVDNLVLVVNSHGHDIMSDRDVVMESLCSELTLIIVMFMMGSNRHMFHVIVSTMLRKLTVAAMAWRVHCMLVVLQSFLVHPHVFIVLIRILGCLVVTPVADLMVHLWQVTHEMLLVVMIKEVLEELLVIFIIFTFRVFHLTLVVVAIVVFIFIIIDLVLFLVNRDHLDFHSLLACSWISDEELFVGDGVGRRARWHHGWLLRWAAGGARGLGAAGCWL